ncbi:MAG: hypothetical protein U5K69_15900 [Balneolaceae bacterium]|nr:hypothetical protein [Balneolaceae bacterium]
MSWESSFFGRGEFDAFTTTFEDLHGLQQLPGLGVQHLMEKGYGFGAEGDWKTAALLRATKVMAEGLNGGTSLWRITPTISIPTGCRCWEPICLKFVHR